MEHFLKKFVMRTAGFTLTAILCTLLTANSVQAADDIYIAGNPSMAPFEYYDDTDHCYKGILPAFYKELEEEMGVSFIYLPPYKEDLQRLQAKNRQVEIVSAHRSWNSRDLEEEIPIYTYRDGDSSYEIAVGFTKNLPSSQAEQIRNRLEKLSADTMLQLSLSSNLPAIHSYIGVIIAVSAVSAVILLGVLCYIFVRIHRRRKADAQKHLGNWADYEAAFQALSPSEIRRLCYVGLLTSDLRSLRQKEIQALQENTGFFLLKYTGKHESAFQIRDDVFAVILLCDNASLAVHRMENAITVLNQVSVPGRPSPTRFSGGIYAPQDATVSPELAFERAHLGWLLAEQKGLPLFLLDQRNLLLEDRNQYLRSVLSQALEHKQFRLYLQFIADTKTGAFCGVEALSRWDEPRGGLLRPDIYLPLLNEAQVIDQLDMGIFEQACRLLEQWQTTDLKGLWITCHFSHQTLSLKHFVNWFFSIANRFHFPRSQFILEASEGIPTSKDSIIRKNLLICKKAGFRIALDDLGSGKTLLQGLGSDILDFVKLDKQFFLDMQTQRDRVVLADLVHTAHDLDLKVVCEGAVTEDQILKAQSVGCDYIQSFYYSQVLPHSTAAEFFRKGSQKRLTANTEQAVTPV